MKKNVFVRLPAEEVKTLERWKALYKSMCKANDALTKRVEELQLNLDVLKAQRDHQSVTQASIETTVQQEFARFNARINALLEENQKLRQDIKALRHGDKH